MNNLPWAGPALVPLWVGLHLALAPAPVGEFFFFVLLIPFGFAVDTTLIKLGLFTMGGLESYAPAWLVAMWVLLGMTYESMLGWRQRKWLLLLLGGVTGPLTYIWCEAIHLLAYAKPMWLAIGIHGVIWAALTPLLMKLRDISMVAGSRRTIYGQPEASPVLQALEHQLRAPVEEPTGVPDWVEPGRHNDSIPPTLH